MYKGVNILAFIIFYLGVLVIIAGLVTILGLGALFSGVKIATAPGQPQTSITPVVTFFSVIAGGPICLAGFLVMGFAELLRMVADIAENIRS